MFHTTPSSITKEVRDFCRSITKVYDPIFLDLLIADGALPGECFSNVTIAVEQYGGERVLGWVIWYRPSLFIEAENHAVWLTPQGDLVDLTPVPSGETRVLFVRDDTAVPYERVGKNNRRKALTSDPLVRVWITAANRENYLRVMAKRGKKVTAKEAQRAVSERNAAMMRVVARYGDLS